jgi:hypothetical protein
MVCLLLPGPTADAAGYELAEDGVHYYRALPGGGWDQAVYTKAADRSYTPVADWRAGTSRCDVACHVLDRPADSIYYR